VRLARPGGEIRIKAADNSGSEEVLVRATGLNVPSEWPREDLLLFTRFVGAGNTDLFTVAPTAGAEPRPYLSAPWFERNMVLSPDGSFAAFDARESSQFEIWLRDFPTPVGKWKVSPDGGQYPRWSPDGRYIYYWKTGPVVDTLVRARVERVPSVVVRAPERVAMLDAAGVQNWDLHPDGKHFIVSVPDVRAPSTAASAVAEPTDRYLIVLNWFSQLRSLAKPGNN
jgi:serine/threonine-protein kinase